MTPSNKNNKNAKQRMQKAQKASGEISKSMRNLGEEFEFPHGIDNSRKARKKNIERPLSFSNHEDGTITSALKASSSTPITDDNAISPNVTPGKGDEKSSEEGEHEYPNVLDEPIPIGNDMTSEGE